MDRKARIREYKETPRPAGLFFARNKVSGRMLVGPSRDLPGMLNRLRFQLDNGSHPDGALQRDWNALGSDAFEFGVLDELEQSSEPGHDTAADLCALLEIWLERLDGSNQSLYPRSRAGI